MIIVTRFNEDKPASREHDRDVALNPYHIVKVVSLLVGSGSTISLVTGDRVNVRETFDQVLGALRCAHNGVAIVTASECTREGYAS